MSLDSHDVYGGAKLWQKEPLSECGEDQFSY